MEARTVNFARLIGLGVAVGAFLGGGLAIPDAHAVPVFARKYETSCQTCHVVFPKLTPFGEAFRRNAYRFPAGEDEDARVDEPIALGHEAHKKVFPRAVWPGDITTGAPLAVQMGARIVMTAGGDSAISFANMGGGIGLSFAATLGEYFAAWAGVGVRADTSGAVEAELERVFAVFKPFEEPHLSLRLGRFEPGFVGFTIHRTLGPAAWISTTTVEDSPFSPDPVKLGIEATGVLGGRFNYAVGLVEGSGRLATPKDAYARLAFKLGGMRLDGVGGATESDPWRETSLQIGGFGYYGRAMLGDGEFASQEDIFFTVGGDLALSWRDLNVMAAFAFERHERPSLADPTEPGQAIHLFAQVDYVVFPWLVPSLRYERRWLGDTGENRASLSVYGLINANVRLLVQASALFEDGNDLELENIIAGVRLAF